MREDTRYKSAISLLFTLANFGGAQNGGGLTTIGNRCHVCYLLAVAPNLLIFSTILDESGFCQLFP